MEKKKAEDEWFVRPFSASFRAPTHTHPLVASRRTQARPWPARCHRATARMDRLYGGTTSYTRRLRDTFQRVDMDHGGPFAQAHWFAPLGWSHFCQQLAKSTLNWTKIIPARSTSKSSYCGGPRAAAKNGYGRERRKVKAILRGESSRSRSDCCSGRRRMREAARTTRACRTACDVWRPTLVVRPRDWQGKRIDEAAAARQSECVCQICGLSLVDKAAHYICATRRRPTGSMRRPRSPRKKEGTC